MKHVAIVLVRAYQQLVSPLLPACCIYSPTCSSFAVEALRRHGIFRGGRIALLRLLRCGPWCHGGHDPVPR